MTVETVALGPRETRAPVKATLKWRNPKNAQLIQIIRTSVQAYGDALSAESVITYYDTFSLWRQSAVSSPREREKWALYMEFCAQSLRTYVRT